ncbi:MAG: RNase adapter RapZ [Clostridiales bacterium]|nr:RNase adapter RapZ [Clostridiales bacterium]
MDVVIVTGLSGAGKTKAMEWFEDRGYYCIDNIPPILIRNFLDLSATADRRIKKVAFAIDIRGGEFLSDSKAVINALKESENINLKVLFVEASNEALIRRFKETRRLHPLSYQPISNLVIEEEKSKLHELRSEANYIIDTSRMKVADFNAEMAKIFDKGNPKDSFIINIMSFGYKKGIPQETDWVIDARFIPNPYYIPSLKRLTGNNKKVSNYVLNKDVTKEFINRYTELIRKTIPNYIKEGKYSLTLAVGCTGGQHRSVALANEFARLFREEGRRVTLEHRDL